MLLSSSQQQYVCICSVASGGVVSSDAVVSEVHAASILRVKWRWR